MPSYVPSRPVDSPKCNALMSYSSNKPKTPNLHSHSHAISPPVNDSSSTGTISTWHHHHSAETPNPYQYQFAHQQAILKPFSTPYSESVNPTTPDPHFDPRHALHYGLVLI